MSDKRQEAYPDSFLDPDSEGAEASASPGVNPVWKKEPKTVQDVAPKKKTMFRDLNNLDAHMSRSEVLARLEDVELPKDDNRQKALLDELKRQYAGKGKIQGLNGRINTADMLKFAQYIDNVIDDGEPDNVDYTRGRDVKIRSLATLDRHLEISEVLARLEDVAAKTKDPDEQALLDLVREGYRSKRQALLDLVREGYRSKRKHPENDLSGLDSFVDSMAGVNLAERIDLAIDDGEIENVKCHINEVIDVNEPKAKEEKQEKIVVQPQERSLNTDKSQKINTNSDVSPDPKPPQRNDDILSTGEESGSQSIENEEEKETKTITNDNIIISDPDLEGAEASASPEIQNSENEETTKKREVTETSESNEPSVKILRNVPDETEGRNNGNENGGNEENEGNEDPSSQISDKDALQNIMDSIKDPDKAHPGAVKRVTDAMKAATDKWFDGITKSGMSMEDFSTAVLMCSLAFPLDALGTLIEKKYSESTDDKLDKVNRRLEALLKQMGLPNKTIGGSSGNGNNNDGSMPDSVERAANMCALFRAVSGDLKKKGKDPDALIQDFRQEMGMDPAIGKMPQELDPEEVREKFQTTLREDKFQELKESFKRVANTEPGRKIIRGAFGYDNGNEMIRGLLGRDLNEYEKGNATPRIAETIMDSYQKIMDSDGDLTKAEKQAELATFLVEMGKEHPGEFKTLSDAFLLVQKHKDLLDKLREKRESDPMVQRGSGDLFDELTDAGERKIKENNFREAFEGLNLKYGKEKETVNTALHLQQILKAGSEKGQVMLTAFVQSKADLAGKRNR